MKNYFPIGFIDSGIGGVTTLKETIKLLPNENYIYFADSKNAPYGDKTNEEIFELVKAGVDFLVKKGCKIIVLACNTATNICIYKIRHIYNNIPIIGAVPALKVATKKNKNQNILIMATPATINSEKFLHFYYTHYTPNIKLLSCPNLASLIENGKQNEIDIYLKNILKGFEDINIIVLGCTHYIYIKKNIKKILKNVKFVDGNKGIARQIKKVLIENNLLNDSLTKGNLIKYDTKHLNLK